MQMYSAAFYKAEWMLGNKIHKQAHMKAAGFGLRR